MVAKVFMVFMVAKVAKVFKVAKVAKGDGSGLGRVVKACGFHPKSASTSARKSGVGMS